MKEMMIFLVLVWVISIDFISCLKIMGVASFQACCSEKLDNYELVGNNLKEIHDYFWGEVQSCQNIMTANYHNRKIQQIKFETRQIFESSKSSISMSMMQNKKIIFRRYKDKFIYAGQSQINLMHGSGILVFPYIKTYVGGFSKGEIFGKGVFVFREEKYKHSVRFQAIWSHNNIFGNVKTNGTGPTSINLDIETIKHKTCKFIKYQNFDQYIGEWNGWPHGRGKYVYRNNVESKNYPFYQGMFSFGLRQGLGTLHYDANKYLIINWTKGRPNGSGELVINGFKQSVTYKNGKRITFLRSEYGDSRVYD